MSMGNAYKGFGYSVSYTDHYFNTLLGIYSQGKGLFLTVGCYTKTTQSPWVGKIKGSILATSCPLSSSSEDGGGPGPGQGKHSHHSRLGIPHWWQRGRRGCTLEVCRPLRGAGSNLPSQGKLSNHDRTLNQQPQRLHTFFREKT